MLLPFKLAFLSLPALIFIFVVMHFTQPNTRLGTQLKIQLKLRTTQYRRMRLVHESITI